MAGFPLYFNPRSNLLVIFFQDPGLTLSVGVEKRMNLLVVYQNAMYWYV